MGLGVDDWGGECKGDGLTGSDALIRLHYLKA